MFGYYEGRPVTITGGIRRRYRPKYLEPDCPSFSDFNVGFYESLLDFCRRERPQTVCLLRKYALGDILMLLPIVRALRRTVPIPNPVRIVVEERFVRQLGGHLNGFDPDFFFVRHHNWDDYGCDVHVDFNKELERDHWGREESQMHRLEIYGRALGLSLRRAGS